MATRRVKLLPHQVGPTTRRFTRDLVEGCKRAMRETAMFGVTAVARTTGQTKPRPRATGQYEQGWAWQATKHGAVLGNASKQAFFVERGRQPGKKPPLEPILEWVKVKRIYRTKKGALKKHLQQSYSGNRRDVVHRDPKTGKVRQGAGAANRYRLENLEKAMAFSIQAKIGRVGTKARWVLRRTMPVIGRRSKREVALAVREAIANVRP